MSDMTDDVKQRVEGQIWAAIRAGIESHEALLGRADRASTYESASAFRDEAARHIADGVLARPDVQSAIALSAAITPAVIRDADAQGYARGVEEAGRRWLAFDIGCIECGEGSIPIGLFGTKEDAEVACLVAEKEQSKDWNGQHSFEVFDLSALKHEQPK